MHNQAIEFRGSDHVLNEEIEKIRKIVKKGVILEEIKETQGF